MPTKSHILVSGRFWTREDWGHVALSSIIPLGVGAVAGAAFVNDRESYNWYMQSRKPTWAPEFNVSAILDGIGLAPLGYASYLIYKIGGFDFPDTKCALLTYGGHLAMILANIPVVKKRCYSTLLIHAVGIHATAVATAYLFSKVDKEAAIWVLPQVLITGFYAFLAWKIKVANEKIQ